MYYVWYTCILHVEYFLYKSRSRILARHGEDRELQLGEAWIGVRLQLGEPSAIYLSIIRVSKRH